MKFGKILKYFECWSNVKKYITKKKFVNKIME